MGGGEAVTQEAGRYRLSPDSLSCDPFYFPPNSRVLALSSWPKETILFE